MHTFFFRVYQYVKYLLLSKGRHGTHSPFAYHLVDQVFPAAKKSTVLEATEAHLKKLKKDKTPISITDFKTGVTSTKRVCTQAKGSTSTLQFRKLLRQLCADMHVTRVLEAGTSFGVSTSYLSGTKTVEQVHTIEGNECIAKKAVQFLSKDSRVNVYQANVHAAFEKLVEKVKPELVFLDADHRGQAIKSYLDTLRPHLAKIKVIVIHDIYWSKDMYDTWRSICTQFPIAVDIYQAGLLFPSVDTPPQQFRLKY